MTNRTESAPGLGRRLAFAGAVAVGAALAAGELLAGVLGTPSPLLSVARFIVDVQPPGAKDFVVSLFGENDKAAFEVFIILVAVAVGAVLGRLAPARPDVAAGVLAAFAGAGFAAALRDPNNVLALSAAVAGVEAVAGIWALRRLVALATSARPSTSGSDTGMESGEITIGDRVAPDMQTVTGRVELSPGMSGGRSNAMAPNWRRRSLLQAGGALAVGSLIAGSIGRYLLERQRAPAAPTDLPGVPVAAELPPGADIATADLMADGLAPIVIPNDHFYRIDTAFIPPTVDRATWRLRLKGLVDREIELTYDDLVALPIIEQYVTIACVSNEVGGGLVGNAKWTGVALRDVLDIAGVQPAADQLVGRSVDGWTAGMPVEWVMDESRIPMIAVGMNDEPLRRAHGYPARLIVPGLYGYVSATKWLTELELTRFDLFKGYWVPLGWAERAPILTQSRIDVPSQRAQLQAGAVPIAGVAWAPDRGIQGVEVQVDGGPWLPARLSAPISDATWVQWLFRWDATPGSHEIVVRAIDGTGEVQTDLRSRPAPDGARGHHTITVSVA
jgi:DMSO/TMAO reductase YedYZ molybdopterin-dependent catalytic subunit